MITLVNVIVYIEFDGTGTEILKAITLNQKSVYRKTTLQLLYIIVHTNWFLFNRPMCY